MNSLLSPKVLLIVSAIIGLCFIILSETESIIKQGPVNGSKNEKPEAFIEGAKFTLYNEEGHATHLISERATFYADSDKIDIQNIKGTLTNTEGQVVTLSSNSGKIEPTNDIITLHGDVLIQQTIPEKQAWSIKGHQFIIDKKRGFISSKQAVTISQNQSTIQAIGLNAWLNEKRIELLSDVRGQYAFN